MFRPKFRITIETYLTEEVQQKLSPDIGMVIEIGKMKDWIHQIISRALMFDAEAIKTFEHKTVSIEEIPSKFGGANNNRWLTNTFQVNTFDGKWRHRGTFDDCAEFLAKSNRNKQYRGSYIVHIP